MLRSPAPETKADPVLRIRDLELLGERHALVIGTSPSQGDWLAESTDGGASFLRLDRAFPERPTAFLALATGAGGLWLLTRGSAHRSDDEGKTWAVSRAHRDGYGLFGSSKSMWLAERSSGLSDLELGYSAADVGVVTDLVELRTGALVAASFGRGVLRSADGGATWKPEATGLSSRDVTSLALLTDTNLLLGTFGSGVFRSTNAGASWEPASVGLEELEIQDLVGVDARRALAASTRGLFTTVDGGLTWARAPAPIGAEDVTVVRAAGSLALAGTWGNGLYRSVDGGTTWTPASLLTPSGELTALSATPTGPMYVGFEDGRVYAVTPETGTWRSLQTLAPSAVRALAVGPKGEVAGATARGVYRRDASGWVELPTPDGDAPIVGLVATKTGRWILSRYAGTFPGGALFTADHLGAPWQRVAGDCGKVADRSLAGSAESMVVISGCRCRSLDGGRTFLPLDRALLAPGCTATVSGDRQVIALKGDGFDSSRIVLLRGEQEDRSLLMTDRPYSVALYPDGTVVIGGANGITTLAPGSESLVPLEGKDTPSTDFVARRDGGLVARGRGLQWSADRGRSWVRLDPEPTATPDGEAAP